MNSSLKSLVFVVGGAYGFSDEVSSRVFNNLKKKFSNMTFSHQMIRLLFKEQLIEGFLL